MSSAIEVPASLRDGVPGVPAEPVAGVSASRPQPGSSSCAPRAHRPQGRLVVAGFLTVVAGVLRLWSVNFPSQKIFDEAYYPANAHELLRQGYENDPGGSTSYIRRSGKWFIAAGIEVFGNNSVGWRVPPRSPGPSRC